MGEKTKLLPKVLASSPVTHFPGKAAGGLYEPVVRATSSKSNQLMKVQKSHNQK
jgi:hypothetical protein